MVNKNIVLFDGSNSVFTYGLRAGLSLYANVKVLALSGSTAIQKLYELNREKNKAYIKNADLIVTESNLNEIGQHTHLMNLSLELIALHCSWFYESLSRLGKTSLYFIASLFWKRL